MFHHVSMMIFRYRMKTEKKKQFLFLLFPVIYFSYDIRVQITKTRELSRRIVQSNQAGCFFSEKLSKNELEKTVYSDCV